MNLNEKIKQLGMMKLYSYLDKDPETNIPKLLDWYEKNSGNTIKGMTDKIIPALRDPDNNWRKLADSIWTDIDPTVRRRMFENIAINSSIIGTPKQKKMKEKYGCNIPWAILLDPTSACNLECTGCWAAKYGHNLSMSFDELDNIIEQGKELGTYMYLFSGGEPLIRRKDIIALCNKHSDCEFLTFTNGTLIDEEFCRDALRVANFIPAISVEGFEEATDFRRGAGTFKKAEAAMALLKKYRLPFGISCCYTSKNVDEIGSEEYYDQMIEWGAKFCWFFTYMPVGKDAAPELMATAEQRRFMYEQVRKFRKNKPIFTIDFWNDGEYVHGCIAGGRSYLHINAGGDIEPCGFIHYSDSNIRDKTLLEAYQSPMFMAYRAGQPFNENMLRPCPLLDNPEKLVGMVERTGAHSTDMLSPEDVHDLAAKCEEKAAKWAETADGLWRCRGCAECVKVEADKN